jgi:hypothetical protein
VGCFAQFHEDDPNFDVGQQVEDIHVVGEQRLGRGGVREIGQLADGLSENGENLGGIPGRFGSVLWKGQ